MKETGHGREDLNRNKLVITGKLCYYKPVWFCMAARNLHEFTWTFRPLGSVMSSHALYRE